MKSLSTMSKKKESVYNRQPVFEKVDITSTIDGMMKNDLIELMNNYPDDAYIDVDTWYSETIILIRYKRMENDKEYNKRIEEHKKRLATAAKAKATKEERARLAAVKKAEQEKELYLLLKEKYGE